MLVGTGGWTQRWKIVTGQEEAVSQELLHLGTDRTGRLPLLDPETDNEVAFVVAWTSVAAAVIIPSSVDHTQSHGQYA